MQRKGFRHSRRDAVWASAISDWPPGNGAAWLDGLARQPVPVILTTLPWGHGVAGARRAHQSQPPKIASRPEDRQVAGTVIHRRRGLDRLQISNARPLVATAFEAAHPNVGSRASRAPRPSVTRKIYPQKFHRLCAKQTKITASAELIALYGAGVASRFSSALVACPTPSPSRRLQRLNYIFKIHPAL